MRFTIIAASLVAASAIGAYAGDDDIMGTRYGNTTLVHETLGTSRIWYNKDHTFTAANWIMSVSGKWEIKDGKTICLHYNDPAPPLHPNPECESIAAHKIGDKWTLGGRDFELVQGIQK